jgi:acyl-CoA dehydrogenase
MTETTIPEAAAAAQLPPHPVPDRHGASLFAADPQLAAVSAVYLPEALHRHLLPHLARLGERAGGELDELAQTADKHPPALQVRSRTGRDEQRIVKHPAYVALEKVAFSDYGLAAMSHRAGVLGWPEPMPPAAKYALSYLLVQAEFGLCCPLSMTDSLTRTLRRFGAPALVDKYLGRLTTQDFDALAQGAMFMTEQAAGSDIAATEVRAQPDGDAFRLWGDKWFCSNPDAGLAMVLARIDGAPAGMAGVSLFLLPRTLDDGRPNAIQILRLKDKLGTRSMASGEIRLAGARAWLVGEAGRGFQQMADMVNNSRLSNGMRAAGLMRRACTEALHVARERRAFGRRLIDLPLMRRQLLKLLLPTEQARTMLFQAVDALRRSDAKEDGAYALTRILTPLIKFRACRDARRVTGDAMEVRGGCGYIEEWSDPRLLRDAHLGSIWEGTSNIVALDVFRAIRRDGSLDALRSHLQGLLDHAALAPGVRRAMAAAADDALAQAAQVADARGALDHAAREVASRLYHVTTAVAMAWEATRIGSKRRMQLAQLVLRERTLPRATPALTEEPAWLAPLLDESADTESTPAQLQAVDVL